MTVKRKVIETWFQRVWNERDATAIDELFVVNGEARGLGDNSLFGPKDFKVFHATLCALLSDIVITVDKSIEENDWISAICTLKAKSQKTGEPIGMTGHVLVKVKEGQLVEAYNHWDFIALFSQLGSLPPKCFERGLAGEKIA
jgi:hypothetical protein